VTSQDQIDLQAAGLDEGRPPATVGWRRPKRVRLEGEELVFEWSDDQLFHARAFMVGRVNPLAWWEWRETRGFLMTLGIPDVYPTRALLIRFAALAEQPDEKIRAFAERFGALQEPVSREAQSPTPVLGPDFMPQRPVWAPPPVLPDRQTLVFWRRTSLQFSRALLLAAKPQGERDLNEITWLVNGHFWQAAVEDFLAFENGQPRILHSAGGLYGGLAVELLSAVARVGLRLCVGCGSPLEKGGRRYCAACRDSGVPERNRQTNLRARRSQEKSAQRPSSGS
jgi:hypothetical protein